MVKFPALMGDVVTESHAALCREQGHASHRVDGVDTEMCPRCGEVKRSLSAGPIFETVTVQGDRVSVAVEPLRHGLGLVVRDHGAVVMAMPAVHVSRVILSDMFDSVDVDGIMARLSE